MSPTSRPNAASRPGVTERPSELRASGPRASGLRPSSLAADARILLSLMRGLPRRSSHAEALAGFYGPQAERYDDFRERLLQGREQLIRALPSNPGDRIVELGGGTGRNLEFFGPRLSTFAAIEVVDLCQPLLDVAARRVAGMASISGTSGTSGLSGTSNVRLVNADASTYQPSAPVDCVYLSYALTMMPRWDAVVDNAAAMLRPGGTIGVVDFYVSPAHPPAGRARHGWLTRTLWPAWFRHDGVRLSADHLAYLQQKFEPCQLSECRARVPYLPLVTAPYYVFIGRKRS
jgi:S-adenosylmethionine-diacylgycerolhomoserine-N-methlytransferase